MFEPFIKNFYYDGSINSVAEIAIETQVNPLIILAFEKAQGNVLEICLN